MKIEEEKEEDNDEVEKDDSIRDELTYLSPIKEEPMNE